MSLNWAAEPIINIYCEKGENKVDDSTETIWFKKLPSGCKKLDDLARSGRHKIMYSKAMLQAMKANLVSRQA